MTKMRRQWALVIIEGIRVRVFGQSRGIYGVDDSTSSRRCPAALLTTHCTHQRPLFAPLFSSGILATVGTLSQFPVSCERPSGQPHALLTGSHSRHGIKSLHIFSPVSGRDGTEPFLKLKREFDCQSSAEIHPSASTRGPAWNRRRDISPRRETDRKKILPNHGCYDRRVASSNPSSDVGDPYRRSGAVFAPVSSCSFSAASFSTCAAEEEER